MLGAGAAMLLVATGATRLVPPLGRLVDHGGASRVLATAVLAVDVWVLLLLGVQLVLIRREGAVLARERQQGPRAVGPLTSQSAVHTEVYRALVKVAQLPASTQAGDGKAAFLTSGYSSVRAARAETPYTLLRALVWALPALGFIGTAAEMARAIGGLSSAVKETGSYNQLANTLVPHVIQPLAGAFSITLFALGSSVVGHVLLTMVHTREERLALDLDELVLERMGALRPQQSTAQAALTLEHAMSGAAQSLTSLTGELRRLGEEARKARIEGQGSGAPERHTELIQQLSGIGRQLMGIQADIREGLSQEMVLAPVRRPQQFPEQNGQTPRTGDGAR
ncbi:hypothetical protein [Streptomyces sp. Ru72]|uniref:hypothetical protein n=1 Tax=Streptomyces sp. Ru72 TaxID=2080747 RepID=UPI000CDE4C5B|nr:hypothetical protein [Streptomyces sp. Ru72]POX52431.1 hypothetical protein C3488_08395 [Streptomyces sp. Ru72]